MSSIIIVHHHHHRHLSRHRLPRYYCSSHSPSPSSSSSAFTFVPLLPHTFLSSSTSYDHPSAIGPLAPPAIEYNPPTPPHGYSQYPSDSEHTHCMYGTVFTQLRSPHNLPILQCNGANTNTNSNHPLSSVPLEIGIHVQH
ncbi:hypothetical protein EX30DRAFT_253739 [Ascodesmis nigricans]|uniref:Uncharacterized protein n=1 Tax=Ascodesmis nigricans TaxID=341454 RepID=A0A4V3SIV8_9PEZI|nr:hypothetical protein EX30DRAFT_253739 [Ascodesmis nigricans]